MSEGGTLLFFAALGVFGYMWWRHRVEPAKGDGEPSVPPIAAVPDTGDEQTFTPLYWMEGN